MSGDPVLPPTRPSMPDVQVFLSRPAYPLGSAVVGTIVIQRPTVSSLSGPLSSSSSTKKEDLRKILKSVVVYVAGFCRIDPRWHTVADYTRLYGTVHPFLKLLDFDDDLLAPPAADETICFWATNGMDLLTLKERTNGRVFEQQDQEGENNLLAFTFRVDIPLDLPHSIGCTTCRYHYTADVLIQTATQQRVIKTPFQVWTNPDQPPRIPRSRSQQGLWKHNNNNNNNNNSAISGARVKFGIVAAMAHSNGWPSHLSATELHRPKGQMTVVQRPRLDDVQTLRVSNAQGKSVCVVTVIGGAKLTPGSQIHLQWDFADDAQIPCHQVAACLMGEELAVYEDGSTTRTQSYVFDTCHEWVDPGITQRVSKTMLLSMDAPCGLCTDIVELSIQCQIDITIKEKEEYNNLRLQLPCHVVHCLEDKTKLLDDDEEEKTMSLSELLRLPPDPDFPQNDIAFDLKTLAFMMEARVRKEER